MKRVALLLTCLIITSTAIAADKLKKKVELEDAPAISAPKAVDKPWEPTAFVQAKWHLTANYEGLDLKKFFEMFESKLKVLKKGEYETTEEFVQRTANKDALLSPINTSDLYAFRVDDINIKYDADAQEYMFSSSYGFSCKGDTYGTCEDWLTCKLASASQEVKTYTGGNAYGATASVTSTRGRDIALAVPKCAYWFKDIFEKGLYSDLRYNFKDKISVPLKKARTIKDMKLAVLFVGQVSAAKIIEGRSTTYSATIDSPSEIFITEGAIPFDLKKIIYYVVQTGEILGQKSF